MKNDIFINKVLQICVLVKICYNLINLYYIIVVQ